MPIKHVPRREVRSLTVEQKVAFVLLLFLGIGGLILGFRSFGSMARRPFDLQISRYLQGEKFVTTAQKEQQDLEASKTRDTDGDGLMDYDELYVYKTSPYLVDSDSDGFDDKTEVFSGNDPTCPSETDCHAAETAADTTVNASGLIEVFGGGDSLLQAGDINFENPQQVEAFFKKATLDEIRNALLQAGVPQADLDQITDAQLEEFFSATIDEASQQGAFDALVNQNEQQP